MTVLTLMGVTEHRRTKIERKKRSLEKRTVDAQCEELLKAA